MLLAELDAVLDETDAVLARLTAADLGSARTIQGREVTVLDAVYHVVEHFSFHLGQMVLIARRMRRARSGSMKTRAGLARPL